MPSEGCHSPTLRILLTTLLAILVALAAGQAEPPVSRSGLSDVIGHIKEEWATLTEELKAERWAIAHRLIDEINRLHGREIHWRAGIHERFAFMHPERRKRLMGTVRYERGRGNEQQAVVESRQRRQTAAQLPTNFDSRQQWPHCAPFIGAIRDQSMCGCCWTVSSTSVITDRNCIEAAKVGIRLDASLPVNWASAEDMMTCSGAGSSTDGCQGGFLGEAFHYAASHGVMTGLGNYTAPPSLDAHAGCKPYPFPPSGQAGSRDYNAPSCSHDTCTNPRSNDNTRITMLNYTSLYDGRSTYAQQMQAEIYANGPISVGMDVKEDLFYYTSGVYSYSGRGAEQGGHAVRIIGWGVDAASGQPYWLVANSWGPSWGEGGLFRIRRGTNECGIESQVSFGQARAPRSVPTQAPTTTAAPTRPHPTPSQPYPGPTQPHPGPTHPYPGPTHPYPGPTRPYPGPTQPHPGPTHPYPGPTHPYPGPTHPYQGPTRPYPGPTQPHPGPTHPYPGPTHPHMPPATPIPHPQWPTMAATSPPTTPRPLQWWLTTTQPSHFTTTSPRPARTAWMPCCCAGQAGPNCRTGCSDDY